MQLLQKRLIKAASTYYKMGREEATQPKQLYSHPPPQLPAKIKESDSGVCVCVCGSVDFFCPCFL